MASTSRRRNTPDLVQGSRLEVRGQGHSATREHRASSNLEPRTSNEGVVQQPVRFQSDNQPAAGRPTIKSIYEPNNKRFNVIILAAGFGSRLRASTGELPKALIEIDDARAIDLLIRKYRFITERLIVSTGYNAELLEYYVKGKYPDLEIAFSREEVRELAGPGRSFLRALDQASSFRPTLACFCDILIGDAFEVSSDGLVICNPRFVSPNSVVDRYSNVAAIEEGIVTDLVPSARASGNDNGFTGTAVFHNTMLLKKLCYEAALQGREEYTLDFVRPYVRQTRAKVMYASEIFEFGTMESLTELVGAGRATEQPRSGSRFEVQG